MRIDIVSIFPEYLAPLDLSLIGKARRDGLLDVRAWNLREFATDRHRTVDDTPYGGGAGMVMIPTVWGEALDSVLADIGSSITAARSGDSPEKPPRLIVPGPGGVRFTQALAHELATESNLVFACGRYEGIDERVYDYAREAFGAVGGRVDVVSLGDYVLNGGEVAVLAMVEAIGRLLPGVVGNAESLIEESHEDGLLEYPVYTKPPIWRGREVPAVLRSGDHGAIAAWRHRQRLERTAQRRPDLLPPTAVPTTYGEGDIRLAEPADAAELFTLTRACWVVEAQANDDLSIPPLTESFDDLRASLAGWSTWVVRDATSGRLVGSVRGRLTGEAGPSATADTADALDPAATPAEPATPADPATPETWEIGRLMVAPDLQGAGLGRYLLEFVLAAAPAGARYGTLITGVASERNLRMYRKAGFRPARGATPPPGTVQLTKRLR